MVDHKTLEAEGWMQLPTGHFSAVIGPVWTKDEPGRRIIGLLAGQAIANRSDGPVHGGALMTFADMALSIGVGDALGEPRFAAVEVQYRFMASVPIGSLVVCEPEVVRQTSSLIFMRGLIRIGDKVVGSTEGLFKVFEAGSRRRD